MQETDRLAALKRVAILEQLPAPRLSHLAATCRWRSYNAGQQIVNYQERSTDVFFLTAGKVRVVATRRRAKPSYSRTWGRARCSGRLRH